MDGVFLGLANLLLGLCPCEIPQNSVASPWKTSSIPHLLLGLTQYIITKDGILRFKYFNITLKRGVYFRVHSIGSKQTNFQ